MQFIKYNVEFTTWTIVPNGLRVKDCITLTFNTKERGLVNVQVVVNYSTKKYGRMVLEKHKRLDCKYLTKEWWYPKDLDTYRNTYVLPLLDIMINTEYKSVSHFIRVFNGIQNKIER